MTGETSTAAAERGGGMLPPEERLDEAGLRAEIEALRGRSGKDAQFRSAVSKRLREAREEVAARIRSRFLDVPDAGIKASREVADLTDGVVRLAYETAVRHLHPRAAATESEQLSVIAVGGYGRGTMAPFSDVDLLFLTAPKPSTWVESVVEAMLYVLYDMRLKVGHAVRDEESCIRLGREDMTIRTTLLEMRLVCGDDPPFAALERRAYADLFQKLGREFVNHKLEERDARHEAAGGSRYLLNPDLKDGKGGLRDLQTLYWLAKCLHGSHSQAEFVAKGIFEPDEAFALAQTERDLWTYRFHLHYAAGRAEERLHFERQEQIADALGYADQDDLRPVELFMRDYYRTAKEVGDLTRIFCAALEQREEKERPAIGRLLSWLGRGSDSAPKRVDGFPVLNGRIAFESADQIDDDPISILRLFRASEVNDAHIHPDAYRMMAQSFFRVDRRVRADAEANRIFLEILTAKQSPFRTLRRMSETGVLGQFLPEFGHVIGLMQFDLYHHYTVDEHTLMAIDTLSMIERGERKQEHPLATSLIGMIEQRRALYLALLLHDVGKGLGGDHSVKGAEIAARVCPRLGLDEAETETVVWLVRNHLALNHTAQRRDLADPATVRDVAALVQDRERLALLLILTVCDMTSVSPDYWNEWKAQLLRDLHSSTEALLISGQGARSTDAPVVEAREALAPRLGDCPPDRVAEFLDAFAPAFWIGLDAETHEAVARLAFARGEDGTSIQVLRDEVRGALKACVYTPNRSTLLADLAAEFAAALYNVVEFRTYISKDGMAVCVIWVQPQQAGGGSGAERWLAARLREAANGVSERKPAPRRSRRASAEGLRVRTRVRVDNEASDRHTLIEVSAPDRPGLLADLSRAINEKNTRIVSAIITTYGNRAVDSFYVENELGLKLSGEEAVEEVAARVRAVVEATPDRTG